MLLEYQNITTFLQKGTFQIGLKKLLERFMKTNCKKKIKNNLELKK